MAAAAVAFALVSGSWLGWDHWRRQPVYEQAFATGRGQQVVVHLPDAGPGSRLQLDTATQARAALYRDRREVRLGDGQAVFAVQRDPARPFHVYAGRLRITVVGTRFMVRHTGSGLAAGQTVVAVEEGQVRVARLSEAATRPGGPAEVETAGGEGVALTAGQSVVADAQGRLGAVAQVAPAAIAPWRDGRISFDHTPLATAIAEFERYGRTGLVVRDPAVAALPVGGSYSLQQARRFAETLPLVLPVRLLPVGGELEVVSR